MSSPGQVSSAALRTGWTKTSSAAINAINTPHEKRSALSRVSNDTVASDATRWIEICQRHRSIIGGADLSSG
ncbi:hypothetical protein BZM26_36210 [Paraburkholderia strydomiana]|nr:hypothetical protein BZM26_36210 [Paraburkholderia strydomiana]